jgi:hypothetical protein
LSADPVPQGIVRWLPVPYIKDEQQEEESDAALILIKRDTTLETQRLLSQQFPNRNIKIQYICGLGNLL